MSLHHWLRKTTAWIALLAVCFGAFAPTLSQAALKARGDDAGHWVQICSASGITWVRADTSATASTAAGDLAAADPADPAAEHPAEAALTCPWGVVAAGAAHLPPAPFLSLPEAAPHPRPLARAQRGVAAPPSAHAPARAPPSVI